MSLFATTKRSLDFFFAFCALMLLSPLLVLLCVLNLIFLGRPIFFTQERPGRNGKPFTIYKFRTMKNACDAAGRPLPDRDRLSRYGSFLRSTSLDELPELWNILVGDMSFVGPRPLLMQYLDRYTPRQARRHLVRPGLTGWAQINGRNAISWEQKFEFDLWYVENQSIALDLMILARTAWHVIARKGISAANEATMPEFLGSPNQRRESR